MLISKECITLAKRHTGDFVAREFDEIREREKEWDIPLVLRDGGSNMRRAARISQIDDIDCTLHKLQLYVCSALTGNEYVSTLLAEYKQIVALQSFYNWTERIERLLRMPGLTSAISHPRMRYTVEQDVLYDRADYQDKECYHTIYIATPKFAATCT
ncbi:hypothetical protein HHI36_018282 [Cryptolaemus montrouzieri]|uniref:Uncharacterized protein n=1 Tax=Cryptolaemus montrouzieri TaxID=559131 RepID=A0ABD2NZQ2_9CUCU